MYVIYICLAFSLKAQCSFKVYLPPPLAPTLSIQPFCFSISVLMWRPNAIFTFSEKIKRWMNTVHPPWSLLHLPQWVWSCQCHTANVAVWGFEISLFFSEALPGQIKKCSVLVLTNQNCADLSWKRFRMKRENRGDFKSPNHYICCVSTDKSAPMEISTAETMGVGGGCTVLSWKGEPFKVVLSPKTKMYSIAACQILFFMRFSLFSHGDPTSNFPIFQHTLTD